jgi:hypothetical protein
MLFSYFRVRNLCVIVISGFVYTHLGLKPFTLMVDLYSVNCNLNLNLARFKLVFETDESFLTAEP